ncbi:hypothetical protein BH09MYX1_BH09MYX1_08120 [soil metagenome]
MRFLVRSAIVQLYPRTDELPGAEDCDLDAFLDRYQRETTTLMWLGVVLGAAAYHLSPIVTVFVPLPAFLLSESLADKHAHRVSTTNIYLLRQTVFLVKLVAGLAWGGHPSVRAKFALPPFDDDPGTWRRS